MVKIEKNIHIIRFFERREMQIYYKPSINLKVYSVRIIWDTSELSPISMKEEDNQWI